MRRRIIAAAIALTFAASQAWAGVKMPLKNGVYLQDSCAQYEKYMKTQDFHDRPDVDKRMWVFAETKKPLMLSPDAETPPSGYCTIKKLTVSGDVYSGAGRCTEGVMENYTGTYRFSYQVISPEKFMSKGKTFIWCADYVWGRN